MRSTIILLVVALVVAANAIPIHQQPVQALTPQQKEMYSLMMEHKQELCSNLEKNDGFLRCSPEDPTELGRPGRMFKATHQINGVDPVILLPGIGGSSLDASLEKTDGPAWYCFKKHDWFRIWFNIEELLVQKCWFDNLEVTFNPNNGTYTNTWGVNIRPTDFGGTTGVEYLDYHLGLPMTFTAIYANMIKSLVEVGYERGKSVRGAPFDWRLPARILFANGYYAAFQALVEETYTINGNRSVHIVAHSLGCPTALFFLNSMSQPWLDKYVKSFIPIAGPWSGAGKALRAAISGDNFGLSFAGIDIISKTAMRNIARQAGGLVQLFPDTNLWDANQIVVSTPTRNYTISQYDQLFSDIGFPITSAVFEDVNDLVKLQPPRVPTTCIYGQGVPTEIAYYYNNGWNEDPVIDSSNLGDGTVPLDSLKECEKWETMQTQPLSVSQYNLIGHGDIIKDAAVITEVLSLVTN